MLYTTPTSSINFQFTRYITTLELILYYTSVPLTFHIITNVDSIKYVEQVLERVDKATGVKFKSEIVTLANVMDEMSQNVCPMLKVWTTTQ